MKSFPLRSNFLLLLQHRFSFFVSLIILLYKVLLFATRENLTVIVASHLKSLSLQWEVGHPRDDLLDIGW